VRVVLVAPTAEALRDVGALVPMAGPRWTAAAPHSGCSEQFAGRPAAVLRWQYGEDDGIEFRCYEGGVVEVERGGPPVTLVGASDPFRNDRQDEWGNADFATGLLSRGSRVVWLDLHEREQPPAGDPFSGLGEPTTEPPRDDDEPGEDEGSTGGDREEPAENGPNGEPQPNGAGERQEQPNPLLAAFPAAFWATLLLLALALIALALASARRLGAPVPEPLPARVRAAETVLGLGGLYRRARADDASLSTVQAAAVHRLAVHFGLPPDSDVDTVSERIPEYDARAVLGDALQEGDDLVARAAAVQRLVRYVIEGNQK
jgi:hypothetical protein